MLRTRHAASLRQLLAALAALIVMSPLAASAGPRIVSEEPAEAPAPVEEPAAEPAPVERPADRPTGPAPRSDVVIRGDARPAGPPPTRLVRDLTGFELGMRTGPYTASSDWIDYDSGSATYGGVGFAMRWRFVPSWSIEMGFDGLHRASDGDEISEDRSSFNLGALWYFMDPSWWQPYASFGFAGSDVDLYGSHTEPGHYAEAGGYAGIGADMYLGNWRFNTELRFAGLSRTEDPDYAPLPSEMYTRRASDGRSAIHWMFGFYYSL